MVDFKKLGRVIEVLKEMNYPNEHIQPVIMGNIERLGFLMWGKSASYEGPLHNGLQRNDWPLITVLVSNWLMESYVDLMKHKDVLKEDIDIFYDKQYMAKFSINLLKGLIKNGAISGITEQEVEVLDTLDKFIMTDIQVIIDFAERTGGCCGCFGSGNKNLKTELQDMSVKQGTLATSVNKLN